MWQDGYLLAKTGADTAENEHICQKMTTFWADFAPWRRARWREPSGPEASGRRGRRQLSLGKLAKFNAAKFAKTVGRV